MTPILGAISVKGLDSLPFLAEDVVLRRRHHHPADGPCLDRPKPKPEMEPELMSPPPPPSWLPAPVQTVGGQLYIDGHAVCPWCFEDLGSQWCRCNPAAETVTTDLHFTGGAR